MNRLAAGITWTNAMVFGAAVGALSGRLNSPTWVQLAVAALLFSVGFVVSKYVYEEIEP